VERVLAPNFALQTKNFPTKQNFSENFSTTQNLRVAQSNKAFACLPATTPLVMLIKSYMCKHCKSTEMFENRKNAPDQKRLDGERTHGCPSSLY